MPKSVVLLRHAEEPPAEADSPDLSKAGRRRADKLAKYLVKTFGKPAFLFAAGPKGDSVRCYLTLRPLADACGLVIDGSYESRDVAQLASKLLHDPRFDASTIIVAWTHKELPTLASALGAPRKAFPAEWDDDVYDLCFEFSYRKSGKPSVRQFQQPF
jgi:hypothetical protein